MSRDNIADAARELHIGDRFPANLEAVWHYGFAGVSTPMAWQRAIMYMEADQYLVIRPLRDPKVFQTMVDSGGEEPAVATEAVAEEGPGFSISDGLRDLCFHGQEIEIVDTDMDDFCVQVVGGNGTKIWMSAREVFWASRPL